MVDFAVAVNIDPSVIKQFQREIDDVLGDQVRHAVLDELTAELHAAYGSYTSATDVHRGIHQLRLAVKNVVQEHTKNLELTLLKSSFSPIVAPSQVPW